MSKLMIFIAPSFLFFTLFCFTLTSLCSDSLGSFYPVYLSVSITGKEEVLAKACNFFFLKKKPVFRYHLREMNSTYIYKETLADNNKEVGIHNTYSTYSFVQKKERRKKGSLRSINRGPGFGLGFGFENTV